MARTKLPNVEKSSSPPPQRRVSTRKGASKAENPLKHPRPKVLEKGPRPAAKGVVISEPMQTRSRVKETHEGKGKGKAATPEPSSPDSSPRAPIRDADMQAALYEAALAQFVAKMQKQGSHSPFKSQQPESTVPLTQNLSASGSKRPAASHLHSGSTSRRPSASQMPSGSCLSYLSSFLTNLHSNHTQNRDLFVYKTFHFLSPINPGKNDSK